MALSDKMRARRNAEKIQQDWKTYNFFISIMQGFFKFEPSWYRQGGVRPITARYFWAIRSILKDQPELEKYVKKCVHCHIPFFTDPRNAGRDNIGCPFGCREAHDRKMANRRSRANYRTDEGYENKTKHNQRRSLIGSRQDKRVPEGETLPDNPAQGEASQPDGPALEMGPRIGKLDNERTTQPDGSVQEGAPGHEKPAIGERRQPDGPAQENGPRIGEPVNKELAQEGVAQSNGLSQEKDCRIGEPVEEEATQPDRTIRGEKYTERWELSRNLLIYIQIIIRFVDKWWVDLDSISALTKKVRQRCMDFHEKRNYPFCRPP